ncbi:MAG: type III-A CRISPR-associated protein Cas10/Csm1 [Blautia sp.]|nr:type III-A CRISPR-associated protein Cas10/Csm1 [Blautia sp.]
MTDEQKKLIFGSLLHDIGKVLYRSGDRRQHSISGYEFLRDEIGIKDNSILDAVKYHHAAAMRDGKLSDDSLAYIVYIADNIAAASDRREKDEGKEGFDPEIPLQSIFNILNGNKGNLHYSPRTLDNASGINMPTQKEITFDQSFYNKIRAELIPVIKGIDHADNSYVNSLLSTLEAYTSYIPSSTAKGELADISLFDHCKITAAYASSIFGFLQDKGISNYKEYLYQRAADFYKEKVFLLISLDISGIQSFIYTIHSEGALRMLRSRSFYLEILMEHMIDELLEKLNLSRANLIYSGGGHCYILAANTEQTRMTVSALKEQCNDFFLREFGVALYVAAGMAEASANDLENKPSGSYSSLFREVSMQMSENKASRYTPEKIRYLNGQKKGSATRECRVCKTSGNLTEDGICTLCSSLEAFSTPILYKNFFTVVGEKRNESIPLPCDKYLIAENENELRKTMEADNCFIRSYGKNDFYTGKSVTAKLWVGDYTQKGKTTEDYAREAEGIDRIAVLRADVDNLGHAFVAGFEDRYTTLSRTATFSRQLSLFFKHHINRILTEGEYSLTGSVGIRNATIVYSGGDDLFIVGSWKDVLEAAIDIRDKLTLYSEGTLTISAGIGIYPAKYPLSVCAKEVAGLEDASKAYPDEEQPSKNAITLFAAEDNTYSWDILKNKVVGEKLECLSSFLKNSDERGKAFLYRILELIRGMEDKQEGRLNLARLAYALARLEPAADSEKPELREEYIGFSRNLYRWVQAPEDRKQLVTAIYLYVYLNREKEEIIDDTAE